MPCVFSRDEVCHHGHRGCEIFVRGQLRGENCVFQFGVEIFPTNFFCAIWGTFCSLCILIGTSAHFSVESQPRRCSKFGRPKVSHN